MDRKYSGKNDLLKLAKALKSKQLGDFWDKHPPGKDDKIMALQIAMDPHLTTDKEAQYVMDVLIQRGLKPDAQIAPPSQGLPMTPCTATQSAVIRPALLQRLVDRQLININQRQMGFNATLLHIIAHLHHAPPLEMMSGQSNNVAAARRRLRDSAALLLKAGADPNVLDELGDTPLTHALRYAAADGQTELVELLYTAMHGDKADAQAVSEVLKLKPDKIINELLKLVKKAVPATTTAAAGSEGAMAAGGSSRSRLPPDESSSTSVVGCFMTLPASAMRRAELLLMAAQQKMLQYDQVMELIPLAGIPELFKHLFVLALHANQAAPLSVKQSGPVARSIVRASAIEISAAHKRAWIAALRADPRQLGLYALLRWNTELHKELMQSRDLLLLATEGAKAVIDYANHKLAAATAARTPSTSSGSSTAALVKRYVPAFEEMAFSTTALVSWLVQAAGLEDVTGKMTLFEPLGRESDHHIDALTLLGMGHTWAARTVAALCYFPDVAVDVLKRMAANMAHNDITRQLVAVITKVVKRASKGDTTDYNDLRYAMHAANLVKRATLQIYATLMSRCDPCGAAALLQKALPAIASLHSSSLFKAMQAVAALQPHQLAAPAGPGGIAAANTVTADARVFHTVCTWNVAAIQFAHDPELGGRYTAAAAAAAIHPARSSSGSAATEAGWSEDMAKEVMLRGMQLCATPLLPVTGLIGSQVMQWTVEDLRAGRMPAELLMRICLEQVVRPKSGTSSSTCSSGSGGLNDRTDDDLAEKLSKLLEGSEEGGGLPDVNGLANLLAGILNSKEHPGQASQGSNEAFEAALDAKRLYKSDKNCWCCGKTAQEAASLGLQVGRGPAGGKPQLLRCSRCKRAAYCSQQCQKAHWKAHKPSCCGASTSGS